MPQKERDTGNISDENIKKDKGLIIQEAKISVT
jgi:hypothetical protein